jgi:hypothetical protein
VKEVDAHRENQTLARGSHIDASYFDARNYMTSGAPEPCSVALEEKLLLYRTLQSTSGVVYE